MNILMVFLLGRGTHSNSKVVIMLKAMAFLNLSTKNSNRGRENYLAMIRSRSVNKFLFSVTYEAH